ncbi:MAG: trimethylamine methyltransferase family protein [Deltaproteobacteria bacterium]|jgi:trimethylamine--corrinoid protein Co-methyltransferase|nr:trimethylamine methyltransferase family protein [Deltaproteobacteria bacterium]
MLPVYNVLTDQEVLRIHEASLKVLEETGVFLDHPEAQRILSEHGARISDDRKKVFLPRDLVERTLKITPSAFVCGARNPDFDLEMKLGNLYMRQVGGPISLYDMRNGQMAPLTMKDNVDSAKLINALPNIDVSSCMTPQDINPVTYDVAVVKAMLENSQKHFWALVTHSSHLKYELEMVEAVAGSKQELKKRPLFSGIFCVIDPLRYPKDEIDRLLLWGQYHIPVRVPITSLVGANAPYPLAGAMTQINAEFLSSVAIVQTLCPGMGLWYYTLLQVLDMKSGRSVANGPELMLLYAAAAQMSRHYNVPSTYSSGTLTDTQAHQALYHYGSTQTMGVLMGITEQGGAGSIQAASFYSHQAMVLIDESMGYLKALAQGIDFSPETLAVEDIAANAGKGEYLSSKLTIKYLRKEKHYVPKIMDWRQLTNWEEKPDTMVDRAEDRVQKILAEAPQTPLPPETQRELDRIMAAADKEFCG